MEGLSGAWGLARAKGEVGAGAEIRKGLELGSGQGTSLQCPGPAGWWTCQEDPLLLELGGVQGQEWAWGSCPEKGLCFGKLSAPLAEVSHPRLL